MHIVKVKTLYDPSEHTSILRSAPPGSDIHQLASGRTSAFCLPGLIPGGAGSFLLHVPSRHPVSRRATQKQSNDVQFGDSGSFPLLVVIHGSRREAGRSRDLWSDFAERQQVVVLCPLFPADLTSASGIHNYKLIRYGDADYGELLLETVAYVIREWGDIDDSRFSLSGFSGGAQFAHRFWYLHPEQISSLAIAAPGAITLLDRKLQWPRGIQDEAIEIEKLQRAPITIIVGDQDLGTGYSRIEVAKSLRTSLYHAGIRLGEVTIVSGAGHEEWKLQPALERWFESTIRRQGDV